MPSPILFSIYFGLFGLLAIATWLRPARALAGLLCLFALKQWAEAQNEFFLLHYGLTNYCVAALLGFGLVLSLKRGGSLLARVPAAGWTSLALYGLAVASFIWCKAPMYWTQQWTANGPYVLLFVAVAPLLINDFKDLRSAFLATLALGAVVVALLCFSVEWRGRSVVFVKVGIVLGDAYRLGNPLAPAQEAAYIILIGLLMNFSGANRVWSIARWVTVVLGLILVVRTGSRGQLFALLAAGAILIPYSRRLASAKGFLGTVFAIAAVAWAANWAFDAYAEGKRWEANSMVSDFQSGRLETTSRVLSYWASEPANWLLGIGNSSSFDPRVNGYFPEMPVLEVLAEEGLVGFALLSATLFFACRSAWRLRKRVANSPELRGMVAATAALVLFEFFLGFKQGSLLTSSYMYCFAMILGRLEKSSRDLDVAPALPAWDSAGFDPAMAGEGPAWPEAEEDGSLVGADSYGAGYGRDAYGAVAYGADGYSADGYGYDQ